ncbi:MAG: hypothetical protein GC191_04120 [Azospirillum sp.]|nr:hypothetical protein [Azospirillum sp.]
MSARTIVLMGVWSLFMVLLGTMTVGNSLAFYIFMATILAAAVGLLVFVSRRSSGPSGHT